MDMVLSFQCLDEHFYFYVYFCVFSTAGRKRVIVVVETLATEHPPSPEPMLIN